MTNKRQQQKKQSRINNNVTTMQLSKGLKARLKRIQEQHGLDKLDDALDEVLSAYEDDLFNNKQGGAHLYE